MENERKLCQNSLPYEKKVRSIEQAKLPFFRLKIKKNGKKNCFPFMNRKNVKEKMFFIENK